MKEQGRGNSALCFSKIQKKLRQKFEKPLDNHHKLWYNKYEKRGRKTPQTRKGIDYEEDHYDCYPVPD